MRVDIAPLQDQPLQAKATMRRLPELRMLAFESPGLRIARPQELLADNDDNFCFYMEFGGTCVASARGRSVTLGRGEAVLLQGMEPTTTTTHWDTRNTAALVPRAALAPLVRNAEDATLRVIPAGTETLRLLPIYLQAAREELPLASPKLRHLMETHVHDLIALAIGTTRDGAALAETRGLRAARLVAVKADIAAHLRQRDLTLADVAARQGVTPRYVRMLFRGQGTTFSAFVLEQRLLRAHRMLTDPRYGAKAVSDVAYQCGFGDLSHFNRVFRRRFGATPTDLRPRA